MESESDYGKLEENHKRVLAYLWFIIVCNVAGTNK